ncbi:TetR/AcrR family transcriptional regulator [Pantoea sp. JKS000250]|uniref:TetR/AcrR family transcriptional regulator n=1 Tax=Pantoea sp. JKS000250 TaxID=1938795 RepID=UPI000D92D5C1|nr:TetR/AcrR family transcriptional regulator [Pantoea sp. JKS000250]PXW21655.1 TetR family transcriptional regulator [Pantoea sp. JKS000250]
MKVDSFKDIIKKAALKLFKEKGLNNVSTRDLNARLNISRSHTYHYYSNWDELKLDAIKKMLDDDVNDYLLKLKERKTGTISEELLFFLDYLLPDAPSSHWILYLEIWPLSARDQRYADLIHANLMQWNDIVEDIITRGIEVGEFTSANSQVSARQIAAVLDGYSSMIILDYSAEKRALFLEEIFKFSLQMVR